MDSTWLDHVAWAEQQWGEIALGDPRRNRRAVAVGAALAAQPDSSLPLQCGDWAALKGAYRLLDNDALSHAQLAGGHWNATRAQAAQHTAPVLFLQDTSELDFSAHLATTGLGHIGDTRGRGFILHTALGVRTALDPPHVLGVAMQYVWTRQTVHKGKETRTQRSQRRTEYDIWAETLQEIGPVPHSCTWVSIGDRGSDVFTHLRSARTLPWHALIRVAQNRNIRVSEGATKVLSWIRARPWTLETTFEQRAKDGQGARTIRLGIAYDACEVCAPRNGPERTHAALPVWCVRAFDLETQGQIVEWVLLSTLPVTSAEEALENVRWYARRWVIETCQPDYGDTSRTSFSLPI